MKDRGLYAGGADLYDRIYSNKPYVAEAARLRALLRAAGIVDGSRVLEAACGTGLYLAELRKWFAMEGFDRSAAMLDICRKRLPEVPVFEADMTSVRVAEPFDALLCLFSSFGYVAPTSLDATAAAFARCVRPGGVLFIEPWLTPAEAKPGYLSLQTYDGEKATPPEQLKLVRANVHEVAGRKSTLAFQWLVVTTQGVEHIEDVHVLWQYEAAELAAAFDGAGFKSEWLEPGPLMGRGCLLARRLT